MIELLPQIEEWVTGRFPVALATVIKTWGSSPRPVGAGMAVTSDTRIAGSVSGGCVEGAVIDSALKVLKTGTPTRLHFGVTDDTAWDVGLACGGEIDVFVRIFEQSELDNWKKAFKGNQIFCSALVINGDDSVLGRELLIHENNTWGGNDLSPVIQEKIIKTGTEFIKAKSTRASKPDQDQTLEVFYHLVKPKPTLILVGGVHIAIPLVNLAEILGFEVIVIDPRKLFSSKERFPEVKQLLSEWPKTAFEKIHVTQSTAIVLLTHDPKIDDPAIMIALDSPAFYIGALGSQKTHQKRIKRLTDSGIGKEKLAAIHAPVGLDLGGRSPSEIALSVMAEIIQVWNKEK